MKDTVPRGTTAVSAAIEPVPLPESISCVIQSKSFEKSPTLKLLLGYLWQHRDESLSEYAIATEALGRSALFSSKTDATVRVQISRLRQRLDKYYELEGRERGDRIVVPLGSHQIHIERVSRGEALSVATAPAEQPVAIRIGPSRFVWGISVLCALLAVTSGILAFALVQSRSHMRPSPQLEADPFWKSFFGNAKATRITLPTPVFLAFSPRPGESVMFRDTTVNDFSARETSAGFQVLEKLMGRPTLAQNYTVTSDTFASVKLARYLDKSGLVTTVVSSADAPLEALDNENVIAIGTGGTLSPLKPYLDRMSFALGPHEQSVEFRKSLPGDPKRIEWVQESDERSIWPGVIANLPGPGGRTRLLILASRHTAALVSFLTSANGLDQLQRIWKAKGSPDYYEVVVNSEMNGGKLVRFWPVALHPFGVGNTP